MSDIEKKLEQESQEDWEQIWKPLLYTDGRLDEEKIKNEMHDLIFIYNQISEVYCYITGNLLSKPMYYAGVIKQKYDETISDAVHEETEVFRQCLIQRLEKEKYAWDKPVSEMPSDWYHHNEGLDKAMQILREDNL